MWKLHETEEFDVLSTIHSPSQDRQRRLGLPGHHCRKTLSMFIIRERPVFNYHWLAGRFPVNTTTWYRTRGITDVLSHREENIMTPKPVYGTLLILVPFPIFYSYD